MFWSGSAAAQSRVHSVSGTPSLRRGSPVAEMCSPAPYSVAEEGMGELTSIYWSCTEHHKSSQESQDEVKPSEPSVRNTLSATDCPLLGVTKFGNSR